MNEYIEKLKLLFEKSHYGEEYKRKCIEYAERLLSNKLPVIYDLEHLTMVLGIKKKILTKMMFAYHNFYSTIKIPKKSGGFRELQIPSAELKYIQRWILDNILKKIRISKHATGFCNEKSIVDNAKIHIGNKCILNMDIKDFFSSINFEMILEYCILWVY
ncbi:reverse transcriptase domain-containing protein [Fusobacterium vincentii]|uniref:reverse transcriptase domain-containing protein n=1 Tax=Fusobacterium vincentii TaxID=155615 RepID=UPI0030D150FA